MTTTERFIKFGSFRLSTTSMQLTVQGERIQLGARASAVLLALIEDGGSLVTKQQLLEKVWPGEDVGEGNLRVHVAAIRKALSDDAGAPRYLANVPSRGYRFIAPVEFVSVARLTNADGVETTQRRRSRLPASLATLIGRDEEVGLLVGYLSKSRLVTVTGTGGIGKTTVAIAASRAVASRFNEGVYFVDLAAVTSPEFVPFSIAAAVNVAIEADRPVSTLVSRLRNSSSLLVLDNCEHLIGVVSTVVEELLRLCAGLSILATSHEPLRVEQEVVLRLAPFSLASYAERLSLADAIATQPAVALFVENAISNDDAVKFTDDDVPTIVDICRRLDGLPLAIEIAAARVGVLGIAELAARLDERLGLLGGGRRSMAVRHQTLRGLLDWSVANLGATDQLVLRRVAVFAGDFSLESATAVAGSEGLGWAAISESIASLARKSLLNTSQSATGATYRLLDSTRLHALHKLAEAGELVQVRNEHAQYLCKLLEQAESDWIHSSQSAWLDRYGAWFDDVRAALGWAFGSGGDPATGVLLCTLAMPLGLQLGLVDEVRDRIAVALARAKQLRPPLKIQEMRLNLGYGYLCFNQNQSFTPYFEAAMKLAEEIGSDRYRFEPLVQLAGTTMAKGRYAEALEISERALGIAEDLDDPFAMLAIKRVLAQVSHFVGDPHRSIDYAQEVIGYPVASIPVTYGFVATDRRISMRVALARSLWVTGRADQAASVADDAMALAIEGGALAICQALALAAIPIRMWRGEWDVARRLTVELRENSERYAVAQWIEWARVFESVLESQMLGATLSFQPVGPLYAETMTTVTGIDATGGAEISPRSWCAPELLRVRGEALCRGQSRQRGLALLLQGRDLAREQGAAAWELRCAISLLLHDANGPNDERLRTIVASLTEGGGTADLVAAHAILRGTGKPTPRC